MTDQIVLSRKVIRALDAYTIQVLGIPGLVLMENAGTGAAQLLRERAERAGWGKRTLVLAGRGNNGGDGFVMARHLFNWGWPVKVVFLGDPERLRAGSDPEINYRACQATGVPIVASMDVPAIVALAREAALLVDAIFGTGLDRPLEHPYPELFCQLAGLGRPVFAVDVPSGLDAETGKPLPVALKAEVTATFAAAKPGFFQAEGPRYCGEVVIIPISIPQQLINLAAQEPEKFWDRVKSSPIAGKLGLRGEESDARKT